MRQKRRKNCQVAYTNNEVTSIPWAVRLSWLENAYSHPLFSAADFDPQSRSD